MGKTPEYPKNKASKHATVRLPKPLVDAVEEFLKTDKAKSMGYLYKVDVVTAATREMLERYGFFYKFGGRMEGVIISEEEIEEAKGKQPEETGRVLEFLASDSPHTIEEISEELKIPHNRCEVIVNFLTRYDLIQREGPKLRISPEVRDLPQVKEDSRDAG